MERVDLAQLRHALRQRWRSGGEWDELAAKVEVGTLADGRWYARIYAGTAVMPGGLKTCAYSGPHAEWYARGTARRWMRTVGGEWTEA